MDAGDSPDRWLDLRVKEVEATVRAADAAASATSQQARTTRLQTLAVAAALVASAAAGFGAYQAAAAVRASEQSAEQQSADNQLSTAIAAIGGGTPAQRVAGMTLLGLNVKARISAASNALARQDAFGEYVTAVDVLTNYIREENPSLTAGGASNSAGGASNSAGAVANSASSSFYPGYGNPTSSQAEPFDVLYAAAQLRDLLGMRDQVRALHVKEGVGVDLTGDELWGLSWEGVNLGWVAAWMPGIDLRGANLRHSDWAGANLRGAFLQCADLRGADFAGAHLAGADLSGANVAGANFTDAHLPGAKLTGIFGKAKGLRRAGLALSTWNPDRQPCDSNPQYWDKLASATQGTAGRRRLTANAPSRSSAFRCAREPAQVMRINAQRNSRASLLLEQPQNTSGRCSEDLDARGGLQRLGVRLTGAITDDAHVVLQGSSVRMDLDYCHLGVVVIDVLVEGDQPWLIRLNET